jgi:hypothetical protein
MDLRERWSILDELCRCAERQGGLEVWGFGSMLRVERPQDLDVLLLYGDRADIIALRGMGLWEVAIPGIDIIAMTMEEESHYQFIELTGAVRLVPSP